ncbi:hypothetical protein AVEN_76176-1 [Araneus ventricosus]|uniref:Uncharacterized protein n=1 Tax=Araneus ventricosus TaxID=182803 RepID=A0A4Y2F141_ARAVE|nr:hypothetical protein AVEN_76176-1 [Araneus ventricosus]
MEALVYKTYYLYASLLDQGHDILFYWHPGHIGIIGNEKAGKSAKEAVKCCPLFYFTSRTSFYAAGKSKNRLFCQSRSKLPNLSRVGSVSRWAVNFGMSAVNWDSFSLVKSRYR